MGEGLRLHWHIPYCEKIDEADDCEIESDKNMGLFSTCLKIVKTGVR